MNKRLKGYRRILIVMFVVVASCSTITGVDGINYDPRVLKL